MKVIYFVARWWQLILLFVVGTYLGLYGQVPEIYWAALPW